MLMFYQFYFECPILWLANVKDGCTTVRVRLHFKYLFMCGVFQPKGQTSLSLCLSAFNQPLLHSFELRQCLVCRDRQ